MTTGLALALGLSGIAIAPRPAQALEILGVCLFGSCPQKEAREAEEGALIDPLNYDVQLTVTDEEAESTVSGASSLYGGREEPVAGSAGLLARAKGDYRRILAALYNAGRYGPSISILVNGQQASSIPAGTQFADGANVVMRVEPGPLYRFGESEVDNQAPPATRDDVVPPLASVGFERGEVAKAGAVRSAGEIAVRGWRQQGYPKAEVAATNARAIHPDDRLDVVIGINEGPYARYGETSVEGTERMNPAFVAYMTDLPEGTEFDPDRVERARKRLDRLGVFSLRRIEEGEVNTNGLMPMNVIVSERKLRRFEAGVTASTIDGLGVSTSWLHRNLFGQAEQLRLEASIGGVGASGGVGDNDGFTDRLDYGFGINFKKPGIFTPDTDLLLNAYAKRQVNETYAETSYGGSAIVENYVTDKIKLRYGALFRHGEFEDGFGIRDFTTLTALGEGQFDFRDSALDPTEGFYIAAQLKPFYEFERQTFGLRSEAEVRGYYDFNTMGRSILAGRVKAGSIIGPELNEIAPDTAFLTGGGGSVRGYAYKSIGVDGVTDETVGGRSLLEGSIEFRQRFGENFGAVAFVDAGVVGADSFTSFDQDVRIGAGVGVRYYTGLGPVRLDVAIPLNPGPDDGRYGIYAGIGHAF